MIREYFGKKAAETIDRSRFRDTKVGKISSLILDEERFDELGQSGFGSLDDNLDPPHVRYRMMAIAVAVNAISWLSVFLFPSAVARLVLVLSFVFSKGGILLVAPALGFTMIGLFSLLRIWFPDRPNTGETGDVMQSYGYQSNSLLTWKLWVVSCGVGGIDALLLVIAYLDMTGEWK